MISPNREVVGALRDLFQTCKDGEHAYRTAAHFVKPEDLKALLEGYAQQRAGYAAELHGEIERLGGHAGTSGTMAGTLQQGWTRIQSAVTGGDEQALLAECGRGDDSARKQCEEVLKQDLSADVRGLVRRQLAGIREAHDRIQALDVAAN
jgi:uncharacterized protein (TIGR02284 family)